MVVAEQHDSQAENYSNVLETSRLRPEVEPFVPKAQNGQAAFYMVGNGGFSLDAPEFIPNVYNGEMYTWMPNQYIVAPASNHPRFSIPRFRDKYMRQHRNRQNNNGQRQNNNHNNGRYENTERDNGYQHRTYNKIEQRNNKSRTEQNNQSTPPAPPAPHKAIKLEKKKNKGGNAKKEEDLITPVDVPDIDESVMSYRAALLGNSAPTLEESRPPPEAVKVKVEVAKSESEVPPHNDSEQADRTRGSRGERRNEKFIPADSEQTYNKTHYNGRGGGRPKPTKGSEIQLNIFSLVQDKKVKKKKITRPRDGEEITTICSNQTANALDSTAPAQRKGKEKEDGKPKKLSKMKKIIVKEKSECSESSDEAKAKRSLPEYCFQSVTTELNKSLTAFLSQLREYNDKAYRTGSAHKRRYCCGLREARKYLKLRKVKCVIIPPNIDKIVSKGGLYDCVHDIVDLSLEQNVPIFYGLNKTRISKILARPKSTITSAVSVVSYDGAEALWGEVVQNAAIARELFLTEAAEQREEGDHSSDEGEEFEDDNNVTEEGEEAHEEEEAQEESGDNESVSSSFVDSGIENNNEISCLSIDNGHTSGEG